MLAFMDRSEESSLFSLYFCLNKKVNILQELKHFTRYILSAYECGRFSANAGPINIENKKWNYFNMSGNYYSANSQ